MANYRREGVSYKPFRTEPLLAEGLLAVARPGGEFWERAGAGLFRLAEEANRRGAQARARQGALDGQNAALAGSPAAATTASDGDPAAWRAAIKSIESAGSGDYAAVGPRHPKLGRALGAYQVMEANVGPWSEKHLGRRVSVEEFMASPDIQDRIFDGEFGSYVQRFGAPDRAAQAWFAGPGGVGKSDRKDSLGTSVGAYAEKFRKAMGTAAPAAPSVGGGGFRPTHRDTAYGRAFDKAGTKIYVDQLETEMRDTVGQLFELHKDDPAALERALAANRADIGNRHVFDEIRGDFETGYDRLASTYVRQARANLREKVEQADRGAFVERTAALETRQAQALAAFDPAIESTADAIASSQGAIDSHYDAAVERGLLSADAAAKAKISSRRAAALGFYGKQADALDADGVAGLRETMRSDFADGGIAGLDGAAWTQLDGELEKLEKTKRAEVGRLEADFRKRGTEQAARVAAGFEPDAAEMARMRIDAGTAPGGAEALALAEAQIGTARAIRAGTLPQARAHVDRMRKALGKEPSREQLADYAFAAELLENKRKAIADDAVSYAEQQGFVAPTPGLLEAGDAGGIAMVIEQRVAQAGEISERLGVAPRFLKAGEARAIADFMRAQPEQGAAVAAAIVTGAAGSADRVLAEFGADAPVIAEAGAILAFGGSARAAEDVVAGYGKSIDGKALKGPKADKARLSFTGVAGGALASSPRDRERIERAAAAIARKRISEDGLDPDSEEALAIHAQAVHEAAGGQFVGGVQYGGFARAGGGLFGSRATVLVPPQMRADSFGEALAAVTDEDLQALPVKPKPGIGWGLSGVMAQSLASTLSGKTPVAVRLPGGGTGYAFAAGDPAGADPQFVQGDDGNVFVLDIMALRDRIAPRVPGAFR